MSDDTGTKKPDRGEADVEILSDKGELPETAVKLDGGCSAKPKWIVSVGGGQIDRSNSIAVDSKRNLYITGHFKGIATFASTTLTSKGEDIFVAKMDSCGKFLWAISAGGPLDDWGNSIAVSNSGSLYITGHFKGTATFGGTTLTSTGDEDVFVAKVNSDGKFLWAVSAGGTSRDVAYSIAVDKTGNCSITGYFNGKATFGSTTLTSIGANDIFVAKLNSGGKFLWAVSAGGTSYASGISIASDSSGKMSIIGSFTGTINFGSMILTSKVGGDVFVAKLDSDGNFLWAVSASGTTIAASEAIAVDSSGNSYITGSFNGLGPATFGGTTLTSKGMDDIFVAKLDSGGKFLWAVSGSGTSIGYGVSIAVESSGTSYITCEFGGTATFGSTTLISNGNQDVLVAKLNSSGKVLWVNSAGGASFEDGNSITVDGPGNCYVTGTLSGTAIFGSTVLISNGNDDIFVAKLDKNGKF